MTSTTEASNGQGTSTRKRVRSQLPPGPLLPAALQIPAMVSAPLRTIDACQRRYGDIFTLKLGTGDVVFVTDPVYLKEMFSGDANLMYAGEANSWAIYPLTGHNSLLTLDGPNHRKHRKLLLSSLSVRKVKGYSQMMRQVTIDDIESWPADQPVSMRDAARRITLGIIMQMSFGTQDTPRLEALERELGEMLDIAAARVFTYAIGVPLFRRMAKGTGWLRVSRTRQRANALLLEEIRARREDPQLGERDDILSELIRADGDGAPLSDEEILDEMVTLLFAGHESTANATGWAFHWLLREPEKLARLEAELAVGDETYLEAVIQETLRLVSVAPFFARVLQDDLSFAGYDLPAGTWILCCSYVMQRRQELYDDPERFLPERFLDHKPDPCAWAPFGGGGRRCVGAGMSMLELKIVLTEVLSRVKLEPIGEPEGIRRRFVTLAPDRGAMARVVERSERFERSQAGCPHHTEPQRDETATALPA